MKVIYLIFIFIFTICLSEMSFAQVVTIQGFVKTEDGKPISGVYLNGFGKTDENGYFKMQSDVLIKYWKALIFDKKGYIPKVVVLDATNTNLNITLEEEKQTANWEIPNCSNTKPKRTRIIGEYLKLTIPKTMKYKSGFDVDYKYFSIGFGKGENKSWLLGGLGNMYAGVYPSAEKLLELKQYSYRRTSVGMDWRGVTKEGNYWRYFGAVSFFETYHYETKSQEAAEIFDKILDEICYQPEK